MKLISVQRLYNDPNKRYVAKFIMDNDKIKYVKFGAVGYTDYLIHGDKKRRELYHQRHQSGKNAIPYSPNALSYHISWGNTQSLQRNIELFKQRYGI